MKKPAKKSFRRKTDLRLGTRRAPEADNREASERPLHPPPAADLNDISSAETDELEGVDDILFDVSNDPLADPDRHNPQ